MKVSIDGGVSYQHAPQGVRIIYEGVGIPGENGSGELHITATPEGVITDVWTGTQESDQNVGTTSRTLDEMVWNAVEQGA